MALAQNVRELRMRQGLSQQDLAHSVGISHPRISDIESGRGNPTLRTIEAIAQGLGVPVERLLKKKRDPTP